MLDLGRYMLGVAELGLIVGFAWLGASAVRRRWISELDGAVGHLASAVLAIAGLLWTAEILGTFGVFQALPYLLAVIVLSGSTWAFARGWRRRGDRPRGSLSYRRGRWAPCGDRTRGQAVEISTLIAIAIGAASVLLFAAELKPKLSTGMTGFDSTWYHGPFAAGFAQSGDTWSLHFIAPQFLAWFYPANSETLHGVGMLAFGRDLLSPLLNLGWLVGCLVACWCIGRPYRVAPFSLTLGAIALSLPVLSDQAGEARNDIVGIFFLLSAVAIVLARGERGSHLPASGAVLAPGALAVAGLSAGLAAGTKLNFLLPAAVLVVGPAVIAPRGRKLRSFGVAAVAAVAGGGYWYLRNLIHTGNPLPWFKRLGPIELPAPEQALGGREGHSVLGYLTDGSVWSDWLLPGLHDGLTFLWPLLLAAALAGLLLSLDRRSDPVLRLAGAVGIAAAAAWLIAPTSASGSEGIPRGFESGLRYLAPALVLGLALLPTPAPLRSYFFPHSEKKYDRNHSNLPSHAIWSWLLPHTEMKYDRWGGFWGWGGVTAGLVLVFVAIGIGYPVQRHYLEHRYERPAFTTPGLNAAFSWAQGISDARIATTSTRQYPLFGRALDNEVTYVGESQSHGGFTAPMTCRRWRHLLNEGDYDYVVTSRDRIEPGKPVYPLTADWTKAPGTTVVLRKPPTIIYKLSVPLDPSGCSPSRQ